MTKGTKTVAQRVKMSFYCRVAGHTFRDRVTSSVTKKELRVEQLVLNGRRRSS